MNNTVKKKLDTLESSMGLNGGIYSANGSITSPINKFITAIQVISESVLTCVGNVDGITSITFSAGTIIYGNFTSIVITSGSIIAYYGVE
jgi:hypothetical protein